MQGIFRHREILCEGVRLVNASAEACVLECYGSIRDAGESQKRVEVAEDFDHILGKGFARGRHGTHFLADNPSLNLFPSGGIGRPTFMLGPFAFFGGVPVAFIFACQTSFLLRNPLGVGDHARFGDQSQGGFFALGAGIEAIACGHDIFGNTDVQLAHLAVAGRGQLKLQIHLGLVGSLVFSEANVAINAGKIGASPAADIEILIQAEDGWGKFFQQPSKRLHDTLLVAFAVFVHPRLAVVLSEFAKKLKGLFSKNEGVCGGHRVTSLPGTSDYTISLVARDELFFVRANPGKLLALQINLKKQVTLVLRKRVWLSAQLVTLSLIVASVLPAQESKPPGKTSEWKAEDVIYAESINDFSISPDARSVVWVRGEGDKEKDERVANLFLSSVAEDRTTQLTRGNASVSLPQWSPDGEWIAFLSSRPLPNAKPETAKTQIWLISSHGGEPYALTELLRAPRRVQWLDKDTLIFSAQEDPSAYEQAEKKKKDDSEVVDDAEHEPPVRLFKIAVKDKKVTRLTSNMDWIGPWSASKDGKYVVAVHEKSLHYTFDQKVPPVTVLHNLADGSEKQIFTEGRIHPSLLAWAVDNSGFYAQAPFSNDPKFLTATIQLLYFYDVGSGKSVQVPLDWENGAGRDLHTTNDGFVTLLAAGAHDDVAHYTRSKSGDTWSWKRTTLEGDNSRNIQSFDVSADGKTLVYESSSASRMPQLFRSQLNGNQISSSVQLTKLNEKLVTSRTFSKSEVIRWKGSNGEEVEGILRYPANYEPGKTYPVITAVHGGPAGADWDAWRDSWAYPYQLLTQRGAFVLSPNYHGSGNYGLKWVESICCGNYYDLETPDINMGVDYLIQKGMVDPDKVATMGWSNGSILSTSLITTYPSRYKVASVGAGDVEWISDWGNVVFGDSFDSYYFGKSPMQDPELYIRKSPFFKMDKVQAPVLIFHGTADNQVPPAQSWSYFRVLQYYGKVAVKFVIFPGEPHGPRKLTHQMRKVEEEMAWFDKYFFKTTPPENEAIKVGSPLDTALRSKAVARSGADYGTAVAQKGKTVVIPEVVRRGELEVGRFEVTRAQFAAFDKSYKADPGTENYPANGVSFEQAKSYAEWLSKLTGQTWRVPNEGEISSMLNKKDGENTLDYWAGYAPNPDDTSRIREKLKELPGSAPLLKPVGTFAGQGQENEDLIFDLGGNAAEWVIAPNGKGKVIGGSADCPADSRSSCTPAPEYVGFRVVRGGAKATTAKE